MSSTCCGQRPRPTGGDPPPRPLSRHLQATLAPQPVSSIGAHPVSATLQEDLDAPITVSRVLASQCIFRLMVVRVSRHAVVTIPAHREHDSSAIVISF
jgi:hypothetical protein